MVMVMCSVFIDETKKKNHALSFSVGTASAMVHFQGVQFKLGTIILFLEGIGGYNDILNAHSFIDIAPQTNEAMND